MSEKISIKDEINNEIMGSLVSGFLPKIKKLLPYVKNKIENSDEFLKSDELILIGKDSNGGIKVLKFCKEDVNPLPLIAAKSDKITVNSIDSIISMFLQATKNE